VIISQICRSPGVYYGSDFDKSGKKLFTSTVIPYRGAWLEYETDSNDVFWVKIDKNRKLPVTVLIRALGIADNKDIVGAFGDDVKITETLKIDTCQAKGDEHKVSPENEAYKEIFSKLRPGEPITEQSIEPARMLLHNLFFDPRRYDLGYVGRYKYDKKLGLRGRIVGLTLADDVVSTVTGEVLAEAGTAVTDELADLFEVNAVNDISVTVKSENEKGEESKDIKLKIFGNGTVDPVKVYGVSLEDCGIKEKCNKRILDEILEKYSGSFEDAKDEIRARLSELVPKHITKDDIFSSINYVICLSHGIGTIDDIDHLGNRRLRCVGELLQNQIRIGFTRMDKNIRERMNGQSGNIEYTVESFVNSRPITTAIREFFGSSPLSQFMDQN
ncbi:MAG: DNA-directed RNA polymerase subunit beta, partial [Firmicutes bacterium]|nr:DNA-directed RNA polymerase subunit beta [Candidatus Colimorpha enterica]